MISQRIKALRQSLHMTQTEFSRTLGLTQGHMTSIENGKRNITGRTVMSICRTYNVNENWLLHGEGEMFSENGKNTLKQLAREYHLEASEQRLLETFLELPPKNRRSLTSFLTLWAEKVNKGSENTK